MSNNVDLEAFVKYNYVPFNRKQCILRLISVWLLSLVVVFFGGKHLFWGMILGLADLIVGCVLLLQLPKPAKERVPRFVCDGVTWLYASFLTMLFSYRVMTLEAGENWWLLIIVFSSWIVYAALLAVFVYSLIKHGKYNKPSPKPGLMMTPLVCGVCGIAASNVFLRGKSQGTILLVLAGILLLISLLTCIGGLNLLKVFAEVKLKKMGKTGEDALP